MKETDRIRLLHILDAIIFIEQFSKGKTKADLYENYMYRFSIERQLEIIGEAANRLSSELREQKKNVPWPQIISFRNFITHEYFGIDLELVWDVMLNHIPALKVEIVDIVSGS